MITSNWRKCRFEERLQIDVNVAPELLSTMIIPFSIQLLVENGIKHGIDNLKKGGQIGIKIERVGGFVKIQVSNPGKLRCFRVIKWSWIEKFEGTFEPSV